MSLMIIAMSGILLGFLCVMVGFFMESGDKKARPHTRKRVVAHHSRAA